ncbi:hypothetical protein BT63DRAFT_469068 [Microthyrium microscopicum]|uniref:Uncharacterized protein n=1 Tax=Microthyrium microscopicum TaxID=703497 RepID=A0A6A6UJM6_9PEZI|nr:hypothetical protein BT63DRAFT_469068 [Microthyrium microscopicum]
MDRLFSFLKISEPHDPIVSSPLRHELPFERPDNGAKRHSTCIPTSQHRHKQQDRTERLLVFVLRKQHRVTHNAPSPIERARGTWCFDELDGPRLPIPSTTIALARVRLTHDYLAVGVPIQDYWPQNSTNRWLSEMPHGHKKIYAAYIWHTSFALIVKNDKQKHISESPEMLIFICYTKIASLLAPKYSDKLALIAQSFIAAMAQAHELKFLEDFGKLSHPKSLFCKSIPNRWIVGFARSRTDDTLHYVYAVQLRFSQVGAFKFHINPEESDQAVLLDFYVKALLSLWTTPGIHQGREEWKIRPASWAMDDRWLAEKLERVLEELEVVTELRKLDLLSEDEEKGMKLWIEYLTEPNSISVLRSHLIHKGRTGLRPGRSHETIHEELQPVPFPRLAFSGLTVFQSHLIRMLGLILNNPQRTAVQATAAIICASYGIDAAIHVFNCSALCNIQDRFVVDDSFDLRNLLATGAVYDIQDEPLHLEKNGLFRVLSTKELQKELRWTREVRMMQVELKIQALMRGGKANDTVLQQDVTRAFGPLSRWTSTKAWKIVLAAFSMPYGLDLTDRTFSRLR